MLSIIWHSLIIQPFTSTLLWIYDILGNNFGLAIILFTILIRALTYPLTASQMKQTSAMQEMQKSKEWQDIQKKYKDDKERLAQEQMKLYQKLGVNPFGSCLPTLIQFPIIIGLYRSIILAMASTPLQMLELTRAIYPFMNVSDIIPLNSKFLWMDLGVPESLSIFGFAIPFLAIVVAATTWVQSKLTMPPPATNNPGDPSAQMGQSMTMMMPLMLGYFTYVSPAGLGLYFLAGNVVSVIQYAMMGKVDWKNLFSKQPAPVKKK
jgi:YidC/Oxa1 family membrane protein insertase